jgi:hypothetical protein
MIEPVLLPPASAPPRQRWLMILAAAAITAGLLAIALFLGDWARKTRTAVSHEERLQHLLERRPIPGRDQVAQALRDERMAARGAAHTAAERRELAAKWGGTKRERILEESARWARTEVFTSADAIYVLYFDDEDLLRAFTFVSP